MCRAQMCYLAQRAAAVALRRHDVVVVPMVAQHVDIGTRVTALGDPADRAVSVLQLLRRACMAAIVHHGPMSERDRRPSAFDRMTVPNRSSGEASNDLAQEEASPGGVLGHLVPPARRLRRNATVVEVCPQQLVRLATIGMPTL